MITVSLETAKKLKAAGFLQTTEFSHVKHLDNDSEYYKLEWGNNYADDMYISAPTTDEILADLSDELAEDIDVMILKYDGFFAVGYYNHNADFEDHLGNEIDEDDFRRWEIRFTNNSLVEALAELWLWAKENNYIEKRKETK